ncbi:LysR family transcriptional regulator (plasmid) [Rhodovastum atsumiense]|uniref:LysR substrate-binding domain-containing protein n=1 Tax=Rhodovastum atsumiense TaxID=504468 RepID=UPI00202451A7|nr:LysR substrate-binding domain-containing protein [Rhodovastum atsumiense]CAH2605486.1 LysR family transcriptional regulator [Rhodovastum atsumiense]
MTHRIPPLAALRAFAAVARHGSFARAAEALHVSTSAISHQIRGLEAELGLKLLHRATNGAGSARTAPTAAGILLLQGVETAFAQLTASCDAVRAAAGRERPVLTISANGSLGSLWLAPRLATFAAQHPSVTWHMRAIEEEPDLQREGLDLAIGRARPGAIDAGERLLFAETVFPVCSPALGLRGVAEELLRHGLLEEEHGTSPEKGWRTWLAALGLPDARATIVRFSNFNQAIGAAIAGAGIALGRSPMVDDELAAGRLVRLFAPRQMPGSWVFVLRRRHGTAPDPHVAQLHDFLLAAGGAECLSR